MEPPWDSGMKVCANGLGRMTKMAAMPIYSPVQKVITLRDLQKVFSPFEN